MDNKIQPVDKKVMAFLESCSATIGQHAKEEFDQNTWSEFHDLNIQSPIEQYLYTAMRMVCGMTGYYEETSVGEHLVGVYIFPQRQIDKYRVDFEVCWHAYPRRQPDGTYTQNCASVIVECDSQEWHERTERERRYEKARDRYFTTKGLKVFHYTGTEILAHPIETACEVIAFVTGQDKEWLLTSVLDQDAAG